MAQGGARAAGGVWTRAAGRLSAPSLWLGALRDGLAAEFAREVAQRRLFPWLAVAFGLGILFCLTATSGPPILPAPLLAAALLTALMPLLAARPLALALVLGLVAALLGFAAAAFRVAQVASPVLARTTIAPLVGLIEALDEREEGARLIVRVESFGTLAPEQRPRRVRVSFKKAPPLKPGDRIAATARLLPPPEAARPGGYDFARDAYFRGIGAVGSLVGTIQVRPPAGDLPRFLRLAAAVDDARNALTRRITDANGGQAGAVAAALVTGKRGLINAETNDILRAAGIYHVVSISGLHMVLAAGVVFWLVRALLALVPALALRWPIKKIAAACAMAGVTAYCVFSGWDIAAERALIMTLVMLGAILVDRPALSMRNLALAALIALAREPDGLLGPSFQMSFGAVAGLIACAPLIGSMGLHGQGAGRLGRAAIWVATAIIGTLATTLVAQFATAPFATYHFQTVQPFGLVGNALTLPLVSLAVMPAAVLGILAYPFALDQPVWWLMGLAVRGMLTISTWIAGFDRATYVVPAFGPGALTAMAAGFVLITLPVSRLRWLGLLPMGLGVALAATPTRPDIYIDREGAGIAVRAADGRLATLGRPPAFVLEQWLKADGDGRRAGTVTALTTARCDRLGCAARLPDGRVLALVTDKRALGEDCARADILVTRRDAPPGCAAKHILDRSFLAGHGAAVIHLPATGDPVVTTARRPGELVPWRPVRSVPPVTVPSSVAPRSSPVPEVDEPGPTSEDSGENLQ
ncbi:ComEC/Rec2 family competence protein [Methylobacterium sp. J-090]|uniref:ComEC/Rec2 family competence protein n=1 Tax=Methylobacterium sp. J-090 TaxID=2836666 RepID=UPI001FBABF0C|nr:ComEC/Rec2 family competence protein [Methylobacterium sp. J-090]MCJ2082999.1 ComEC family competence protein [Methylobacterium sp. J-090]